MINIASIGGGSREQLRRALTECRERYNQRWIIQRLGYLTPAQACQQLLVLGAAA